MWSLKLPVSIGDGARKFTTLKALNLRCVVGSIAMVSEWAVRFAADIVTAAALLVILTRPSFVVRARFDGKAIAEVDIWVSVLLSSVTRKATLLAGVGSESRRPNGLAKLVVTCCRLPAVLMNVMTQLRTVTLILVVVHFGFRVCRCMALFGFCFRMEMLVKEVLVGTLSAVGNRIRRDRPVGIDSERDMLAAGVGRSSATCSVSARPGVMNRLSAGYVRALLAILMAVLVVSQPDVAVCKIVSLRVMLPMGRSTSSDLVGTAVSGVIRVCFAGSAASATGNFVVGVGMSSAMATSVVVPIGIASGSGVTVNVSVVLIRTLVDVSF